MARVLVVDDHELVRSVLRRALEEAGHDVVAEAADGEEGLRLARQHRPHLVMMDLSMPGVDGVTATRRLRRELPDAAVLVVTMHAEQDLLTEARAAGAAGYLLKDASAEVIVAAAATVLAGGEAFDERLAPQDETVSVEHDLTDRELQVLQLLADGATPKQVADALVVSPKTVGNHLTRVYAKLDVHSRSAAVVEGLRRGIVHPPAG